MSLQSYDKDIYDLVNLELKRQCDHLEMIASENFTYPEVMEVMGSILTNKYAEGYPERDIMVAANLSMRSSKSRSIDAKSSLDANLQTFSQTQALRQTKAFMVLCLTRR